MPELFSFFSSFIATNEYGDSAPSYVFLPGNPDIRREKLPPASGEI
jgi:hypothetical protein